MSIEGQAESALEEARRRAIRRKLFEDVLPKFTYRVDYVERSREDEDWLCKLSAIGPRGEFVRGLRFSLRAPTALSFERDYAWDFLSFSPLWLEVYHGNKVLKFSANVKRTLKIDR